MMSDMREGKRTSLDRILLQAAISSRMALNERDITPEKEEACENIIRACRQYMIVAGRDEDLYFVEKMLESHEGMQGQQKQLPLFDDKVRDFYR